MKEKKKYQRIHATVDLDAIRRNAENMKAGLDPSVRMIAVVKSDGYGHGAVPISRELEGMDGLWGFATATVEEALILRGSGIRRPILVLGYTFPDSYEKMVREEIRPAVFREDMLPVLAAAAKESGRSFPIHIKVDTGMSRIGIEPDGAGLSFVRRCMDTPGIVIEGIFTHFARADEADKSSAWRQMERFVDFCGRIEKEMGLRIPIRHCANSAAILGMGKAGLDAVRAGIALYGLWPSEEVERDGISLTPALTLKSCIVSIKELPPGRQIGYGGTYVVSKTRRVATLPVGYGDGYPRSLSNKGYVLICGKRAPILGRVCMDQMMVDVTDIPEARTGEEVTLIGRDQGEEITMELLGTLSGRFNYELACCLNKRIPMVYTRGGDTVYSRDHFKDFS